MKIRLLIAMILALTLTAMGCSSDSDDAAEVSDTSAPTTTVAPTTTAAPATTVAPTTTVQQDTTTTTETSREAASGPVTIETVIDFNPDPTAGTFEVTEGAETLGCSSGTFYDTVDFEALKISKYMWCTEGDAGTFVIFFDPEYESEPGEPDGPWSISLATADFTGLQGEGDFWLVEDIETHTGTETFTGDIEYAG